MVPIKRLICIILTLTLLLSGCSLPWAEEENTGGGAFGSVADTVSRIKGGAAGAYIVSDGYFEDVRTADVDYNDIEYVRYELSDFSPYVEALTALVGSSDTDALGDALTELLTELYYVNMLMTISDISYCANPADTEAYTENLRISAVYSEAADKLCEAVGKVAREDETGFLEDYFLDWQIEWFKAYVPAEEGETYEDPESGLIQEYYTLIGSDAPDYDAIAELYVELVELRNETARESGYDSFADYAYENYYYRSYSPSDSEALHEAVKEYFVPLLQSYYDEIGQISSRLYYSDDIDCSPETILSAMDSCLSRMSPELEAAFDYMVEYSLYDIGYSEDKLVSGFMTELYLYNEPFIFNCPYDAYYDYTDMFHEFGHFVNALYTTTDLLFGADDNDLCELQSQGMEVMFTHYFTEIFGAETGAELIKCELMSLITGVIDGALYDEFQQRVYAEENLTAERVTEIYAEVSESYGYVSGSWDTGWADVSHNFDNPFYYISYAVSAVPALELFALSQQSYADALDKYLSIAAMDLEIYYFDDALSEAGLGDVFDPDTFKAAAEAIEPYLK